MMISKIFFKAPALLALAATLGCYTSAPAVPLFASDFDSNSLSGTTASSIGWATNPAVTMLNSGNLTSLNAYNFSVRGNISTTDNLSIDSNLNVEPKTDLRGFSVDFSVTEGFALGKLTVIAGHINASGLDQVYKTDLNYSIIDLADSSVVASGSQNFDYTGGPFFNREFTLSGTLLAGGTYRLAIGMNNLDTGGAFAIYDGVTLEGFTGPSSNPAFAQRLNFAKFQKASASSQEQSYFADYAVDGLASNFHSWRSANKPGPHWLELSYPRPVTLGSAHLYSGLLNATTDGVWKNFTIQYHDGSTWIDIPGSGVAGNTSPEVNVVFTSPVTSDRFRLLGSDDGTRVLRELAFFAPNPDGGGTEQGQAIGSDVVLNLAYKRPAVASTINGTNYAIHAVDGFVDDTSRWWCVGDSPGQTLEIDLLATHAVGSAHLYSGNVFNPGNPLADFALEAWDGSAWQPIPGGTITGNTSTARVISFTSPVVTDRVRLVTNNTSFARVAQVQIFPPRDGGYPLGQDIRFEPPPTAKWDDLSDSSHRIRIISPDRRLGLIDGAAVFTNNAAGADAINWQLLLNHRDGSYRIRHVKTDLCLAPAVISTATGTPLIGESYSGMPHQDWFLEYVSPTKFRLLNAYSGLAVQPLGGNEALGTPLVVTTPSASNLQQWDTALQTHFPKKGIAATHNPEKPVPWGSGETWLQNSYPLLPNSSWSYSWGRQTSDSFPYMADSHTFNPMQWGDFNWIHNTGQGPIDLLRRDVQSNPKPVHLMGFNEPEKSGQGFISVSEAIRRWPRLLAMEAPLVSPVPASAFGNNWLSDFYAGINALGYRSDYTAVHWYGSPTAQNLINHLQQNFTTFGRPVWLTEFSTVDWNQNSTWTHSDNYEFLAEFMWRAEGLEWLKRYSVFQFVQGPTDNPNQSAPDRTEAPRSNTRNEDGTLTAFGELYAAWDGVTAVLPARAYHIHNRGQYRRLLNAGDANLANTPPEDSGLGSQWFLQQIQQSPAVYRIISTRDGRPLRYWPEGGVGLGPVGWDQPATEWRITPNQYGRFFIDHHNHNARLRNNGDGIFDVVSQTSTVVNTQWRFINALAPEPVTPPAIPGGLAATPSANAIALAWSAAQGAITYTVQRSGSAEGPWQNLAENLTSTTWTDEGLEADTTWFYQILATNTLGVSDPSDVVSATTTEGAHPYASFETWVVATGLDTLPGADQAPGVDPDKDGLRNLLEFVFLTDPKSPGGNPFQVEAADGVANTITLVFRWNWRASGHSWQLRHGEDLANRAAWPVVDPGPIEAIRDGDIDHIRITPAMAHPSRGFYMLEVVAD